MIIVLDTNIIISGTFWTGASFKILELVDKKEIRIIVTVEILKEYDKIIHSEEIIEKTIIYQEIKIKALYKILSKATIVDPKEKIEIIRDDPEDNKFIEAAQEGKAGYIISNDKHLLKLKQYKQILIITPEEFLEVIIS